MTRPSGESLSRSTGSVSASQARPVTSNTAESRFDSVSSGPNRRKRSGFSLMTSRRYPPSTRVASLNVTAGFATSTA